MAMRVGVFRFVVQSADYAPLAVDARIEAFIAESAPLFSCLLGMLWIGSFLCFVFMLLPVASTKK